MTRRPGESILIFDSNGVEIEIQFEFHNQHIRIAVIAPKEIKIFRKELIREKS